MKPTVWIAILHYQGKENTKSCLESLLALDYPAKNLLVIDNASPDNSGEELKMLFPQCQFLSLHDNLGFAGGSNAGIRYCIEQGADWIWLLNNDTTIPIDSLALLTDAALRNDRAAILGATIYTPSATGEHRSGTGIIDFFRAKTFEKGVIDDNQSVIETNWLSGCNMLIRANAFTAVNGFNEDFFLYFEDVDLCQRLIKSGWQCLLVPAARIDHLGGASTSGKLSIWRSYYHTRNRLLFFSRHCPAYAMLPAFLSINAHLIRHCFTLPFRRAEGRRKLKAELLGARDFCRSKLGKADCLDF